MFEDQLKKFDELITGLPDDNCSFYAADSYAVKFLKACYDIDKILKTLKNELVLTKSLRSIAFREVFKKSVESSALAKEKDVEASTEYIKINTEYQLKKNETEYYDGLRETFMNAHIYYKGKARDK